MTIIQNQITPEIHLEMTYLLNQEAFYLDNGINRQKADFLYHYLVFQKYPFTSPYTSPFNR